MRIVAKRSLIVHEALFPETAAAALEVFDALVMVDVVGQPSFGEVARPWIRDFVAQIFGSYDEDSGIRHISEYFMLISKKNGKSTLAAGIMLTALILNWREEAEFIILSPTIEIADNSFKPAAAMVEADPELKELFLVQTHIRTITHRVTRATLKVVAADSATVSGKKAVGILIDELWQFGKNARADKMLLEATGGLASREEGFVIYLTTQSDEVPLGVMKDKLTYARKVRDGIIFDPKFLPLIYEFPMSMLKAKEHLKPENFYVTNPNLKDTDNPQDGSVVVSFIEREYQKALDVSEEALRIFLAKHLNVEIGLNLMDDRWAGTDYWEQANQISRVTIDYLLANCEVVCGGVDGGGLDDLLGMSLIGRERNWVEVVVPEMYDEETGELLPERIALVQRWVVWSHAWAHPSVLKRRKSIATQLRALKAEGGVTFVQRPGDDTEQLAKYVSRVFKAGLLFKVGFDPAALGGILDAILQENVPEDKMVLTNQGYKLAAAIKTAERKLVEGVLVHDGNGLMNWCVGNAKTVVRGNGTYITKQVSGTAKIDPLMAMFDAVELMALNPPAQNERFDAETMVMG